jgi:hypothetical protein
VRERASTAEWSGWDGDGHELLSLGWESGGWTADGVIAGDEGIHYVLRLDPDWRLRQFLLFRDDVEPDLWLGIDEAGRWGEVNGARRPELDAASAVVLTVTPFTHTPIVRGLAIAPGDAREVDVAVVDPVTLGVVLRRHRYVRLDLDRWRHETDDGVVTELAVDADGLVLDHPGRFRRLL